MAYLIFGFIFLAMAAFVVGAITVAASLVAFVTKWLFHNNQHQKQIGLWTGIVSFVIAAGFMTNAIYGAIYPPDNFYLAEFKAVTLRQAPQSAKVISKSASFPDIHGDYCSFSRIKLTTDDFGILLKSIEVDSRFKEGLMWDSREQNTALKTLPRIATLKEFTRPDTKHTDHNFGIRFLNSRDHVEIGVCWT